jgi:hypothetical protein
MKRCLIAIAITTASILALLFVAGHLMSIACFPFEAHAFRWQCDLIIASLGLSFAAPTAVYGYIAMRAPWAEGAAITILAAIVATAMSLFQPFFGGAPSMATISTTVYYTVLPGIIGALAGVKLRTFARHAGAA